MVKVVRVLIDNFSGNIVMMMMIVVVVVVRTLTDKLSSDGDDGYDGGCGGKDVDG